MLVDVIMYTATGEAGLRHILERELAQAWIAAHALEMLAEGYVRAVVTEHVATQAYGDRRA